MGNPAKQNVQSEKGVGTYVEETNKLFVVRTKDNVILGHYDDMTTVVDAFDDIEARYGVSEDKVYIVKGMYYTDAATRNAKPLTTSPSVRKTALSLAPSYVLGDDMPNFVEDISEYSLSRPED